MRLILLAACGLLALASARAQDPLSEVQTRLREASVVRGQFRQTRELTGVTRSLESSGRFVVARGRGVLLETERPFSDTLRVGPHEIVQLDGDEVLMRLSAEREPAVRAVGEVLLALFAGDLATLRAYFDATGAVDAQRWHLTLTPREPSMARLIATLALSGGSHVEILVLTAVNGDVTRIVYFDVEFGDALDAAEAAQFD